MGSNCTKPVSDESPVPPRIVLPQPDADEIPANSERGQIVNPMRAQPDAARQGADQRSNLPRSPAVVDLVSDDEEDYDGIDDHRGTTPSASSPSASPPARPELRHRAADPILGERPSPDRQLSPARPANPWDDVLDIDDDLGRFEGFDDLDVRDADLELMMMEEYNQLPRPPAVNAALPLRDSIAPRSQENERAGSPAENHIETKVTCVDKVLAIFPDICRDHVSNLYDTLHPTSDHLIAHILDRMDKGESYPSAKEVKKSLKRKRNIDVDEDEAAIQKYGAVDRFVNIQGTKRSFM